jgi:hypothetical protein
MQGRRTGQSQPAVQNQRLIVVHQVHRLGTPF